MMNEHNRWVGFLSALSLLAAVQFAVAQDAVAQDAATQPGEGPGTIRLEVVAVEGKVEMAPTGTDPKFRAGWEPVQLGDQLGAGVSVRVPLRGNVKLVARPADPPAVFQFERATLLNISELEYKGDVAKLRFKLGYGAMRAGVVEGQTRSDMEIETPVATLSKEGTDIFRMEYYNGKFRVSLSERGRGLLQVIQKRSGIDRFGGLEGRQFNVRFVRAGQMVTEQMMRAIEGVRFDRNLTLNDLFGIQGSDLEFLLRNGSGLGITLPIGQNTVNFFDSPTRSGQLNDTGDNVAPQGTVTGGFLQSLFSPAVNRDQRSGNFGVGDTVIPGVGGNAAARASDRACAGSKHGRCKEPAARSRTGVGGSRPVIGTVRMRR